MPSDSDTSDPNDRRDVSDSAGQRRKRGRRRSRIPRRRRVLLAASWSGPVQVPYLCSGAAGEYGQTRDETMLDYLVRISRVKRKLRGRVVVPFARAERVEVIA